MREVTSDGLIIGANSTEYELPGVTGDPPTGDSVRMCFWSKQCQMDRRGAESVGDELAFDGTIVSESLTRDFAEYRA